MEMELLDNKFTSTSSDTYGKVYPKMQVINIERALQIADEKMHLDPFYPIRGMPYDYCIYSKM